MANPVSTKRTTRRDTLRFGGAMGVALAAGAAMSANASAQDATPPASGLSIPTQTISLQTAATLIEAAQQHAMEIGVPMAIAVVDEVGVLKAFHRMDGLNRVVSVEIVQMKAYTAASFRTPTHQLAESAMDDAVRAATLANIPGFTLLGGGFPIMDGDVAIGGIGAGGGSEEQDMEVAQAALAAISR